MRGITFVVHHTLRHSQKLNRRKHVGVSAYAYAAIKRVCLAIKNSSVM